MKKPTLTIMTFLFAVITISLSAQKELPRFTKHHKNITIDLLGTHIVGGVSFDMRLNKGRMDGIGFKTGIGGFSANGTSGGTSVKAGLVTFPIQFNHILGKRRHGFVSGIGVLPVYASASITGNDQIPDFDGEGLFLLGGFLDLGYRFQPLKNGFTFSINYTPILTRGEGYQSWVGISAGIGFKVIPSQILNAVLQCINSNLATISILLKKNCGTACSSSSMTGGPTDFYTNPKTKRFVIETKLNGKMYEDFGDGEGLIWGDVIGVDYPHSLQVRGMLSGEFGGPAISYEKFSLSERGEGASVLKYRAEYIGDTDEKTITSLKTGWEDILGKLSVALLPKSS